MTLYLPHVITIDGTSGVGKGTVCGLLAQTLAWHFLDSGAIYRLTALHALQSAVNLADEQAVVEHAHHMQIEFSATSVMLDGKDVTDFIREEVVGQTASKIATYPLLRDMLLQYQRDFRRAPGLIADGRDMGTVVFPDASLKVFLTASVDARAQRRYKQLSGKGKSVSMSAVLAELKERDYRDKTREIAPLEPAKDAVVIDTTKLDAQAVFNQIMVHVRESGILPSL